MNYSKRINKLASLLESVPDKRIETKKKLHKLVYLLQEMGLNFEHEFKYHHYGVFSLSLANDLDLGEDDTGETLFIQSKTDNDWGYTIELKEDFKSPEETFIESSHLELIKSLAGEEPQLLEVLSTIVYLDRRYFKGEGLTSTLHELKPKLTNFYEQAFKLAEKHYEITELQES